MRYFVTGGAGFIGSRVVTRLRDAGHEVRVLVQDAAAPEARAIAAIGCSIHQGDLRQVESLREPMTGCDGVFHIAAWYRVGQDSSAAREINVQGTRNVLTLMRDLGIPKGVYTSTIGVFSDTRGKVVDETHHHGGPFLNAYERTKHEAHFGVALPMIASGLPLVIVMPGIVYGTGDGSPFAVALREYLQRKLPVLPRDTYYSWAHVDDVAAGHVAAMEKGRVGESYLLCGPRHAFTEVFELAESMTGIPAPRIRLGRGVLLGASRVMSALERIAPIPSNFRAETLRSVAGVTATGDGSKARRELGFDPRPLAEGLRPVLEAEMAELGIRG